MAIIPEPPDPTEFDASAEIAAAIRAVGVPATNDPRAAVPPVVLVAPVRGDMTGLNCGQRVNYELHALAPGIGNADAWRMLAQMFYWVHKVYPEVTQWFFESYNVSPDVPPVPAYRMPLEMSV